MLAGFGIDDVDPEGGPADLEDIACALRFEINICAPALLEWLAIRPNV